MTNHTDLIARLRKDDLFWKAPITCRSEAADAIEAAQTEIEREKECTALAVTQAEKLIQQRNAALARLAELTKQEPVMVYDGRCIWDCGDGGHQDVTMLKMIAKGTKLYAAAGASPVQPIKEHGRTNSGDETGGTVERFGWDISGAKPVVIPATNGAYVWYSDYLKLWKSVQPSQAQAALDAILWYYENCTGSEPSISAFQQMVDRVVKMKPNFCESCAMDIATCDCVTPRPATVTVQPSQGLQSVADALTIEQLNEKVERLMAAQPSQAPTCDLRGIDAGPLSEWVDLVRRGYVAKDECLIAVKDVPKWLAQNQPSQADAQDAARYRWLREYLPSDDLQYDDNLVLAKTGEDIDAAIDAAINAKESK